MPKGPFRNHHGKERYRSPPQFHSPFLFEGVVVMLFPRAPLCGNNGKYLGIKGFNPVLVFGLEEGLVRVMFFKEQGRRLDPVTRHDQTLVAATS